MSAISKLNFYQLPVICLNMQSVFTNVIAWLSASAQKAKSVHVKTETGQMPQKELQCRGQCFLMSSKTRLAGKRCLHS